MSEVTLRGRQVPESDGSSRVGRGFWVSNCLLASLIAVTVPAAKDQALAQNEPTEATESASTEYQQAFEAMLADPTSTAKAFAFAEAAVAEGDLSGAIAALERILQIDPDRPDIKLRLGELYQQTGAPIVAQIYLASGLEATQMPPEIKERAEELEERARAAEAAGARHRFSGTAFIGGRYETNATNIPILSPTF